MTAPPSDADDLNIDIETPNELLKIPRIRIKMAQPSDLSISNSPQHTTSQSNNEIEEDYGSTQGTKEESWDDREVSEMVDARENWRVIGLSNVGNTCFTNAILQVFSYSTPSLI
jgi:ubiquitin C-terminal hydrolase